MEQPISFVIRVVNSGQNLPTHGQIEHVATGEIAHFSGLDQVDAFIRSHMAAETPSIQAPLLTPGAQPHISSIFSFMHGRQALTGAQPPLSLPAELPVIEVIAPMLPELIADESAAGQAEPPPATSTDQPTDVRALILPASVTRSTSASAAAPEPSETRVTEAMMQPVDQAVSVLIRILDDYLPQPAPPFPAGSVSIDGLTEQAVGIGSLRGLDMRGGFTVAALKGIQLNALVRFQLWTAGPDHADQAATDLHARLMADRPNLLNMTFPNGTSASVLRVALEATTPAAYLENLDGWGKQVNYRVLFEFRYQDSDGAESVIARIPIHADQEVLGSPERETTVVSDAMMRWDDQAAPLVVHGNTHIGSLTMLVFVLATAPSGTVTLLRTSNAATTPPVTFPTLDGFLAAVTNPVTNRNAQFVFASFDDFVTAFSLAGDTIGLGDWNLDSLTDQYQARRLSFAAPIVLPSPSDRFEILYSDSSFDQVGVLYLRAQRGA